jgi:hypothetical protein
MKERDLLVLRALASYTVLESHHPHSFSCHTPLDSGSHSGERVRDAATINQSCVIAIAMHVGEV